MNLSSTLSEVKTQINFKVNLLSEISLSHIEVLNCFIFVLTPPSPIEIVYYVTWLA